MKIYDIKKFKFGRGFPESKFISPGAYEFDFSLHRNSDRSSIMQRFIEMGLLVGITIQIENTERIIENGE